MAEKALVELKDITKKFPGILANDRINLEVRAGEIHALLGENGAGKSTLMSILTGLYKPDEGQIYIKGQKVRFSSPRDAIRAGIGMVHQHFRLIKPFSVAENVAIGSGSQGIFLQLSKVEQRLSALSEEYGLRVDPTARVWQLSVGEQQRVEIMKILYTGVEILILDEPTAVLTPGEAEDLYQTLRRMADQGKAIIVITHKLQEVMGHSDRVTVLRGGRSIATVETAHTNEKELARMMVGRELQQQAGLPPTTKGQTILALENVFAKGDKGLKALKGVSLEIKGGEILGIAGVAGNGQRELAEVIAGLRPSSQGNLFLNGTDFTNKSPQAIIDAGVSYVPEDRLGTGLAPNLGVFENIVLKDYRNKSFLIRGFLNWPQIKRYAQKLVTEFDVKVADLNSPVKMLSGGNLQRLLLAREISADPVLIIAVYPFRGLDVGAIEVVRKMLLAQRAEGKALLLVSEELEELFTLADRIAVLHEGEIMGIREMGQFDIEEIGMMMAGRRQVQES